MCNKIFMKDTKAVQCNESTPYPLCVGVSCPLCKATGDEIIEKIAKASAITFYRCKDCGENNPNIGIFNSLGETL